MILAGSTELLSTSGLQPSQWSVSWFQTPIRWRDSFISSSDKMGAWLSAGASHHASLWFLSFTPTPSMPAVRSLVGIALLQVNIVHYFALLQHNKYPENN